MQAKRLWSIWQALLLSIALGFTTAGRRRFVEWVTGLALNVEEHTITQSLVGLDRTQDWKALESFAEYGHWCEPLLAIDNLGAGTADLSELKATIARQTGRAWGELPGHLRTEILQMAQGRYRDDYARIIQLYFREIATGAERPKP